MAYAAGLGATSGLDSPEFPLGASMALLNTWGAES